MADPTTSGGLAGSSILLQVRVADTTTGVGPQAQGFHKRSRKKLSAINRVKCSPPDWSQWDAGQSARLNR